MPTFTRDKIEIYYEEYGSGYPILLFAPGGVRSAISWWHPAADGTPRAWMDPTVALAQEYRVVAMDQRNAEHSRAPIRATDSWKDYAQDHIALMDHLGRKRFHTMGGCIGSSYCLSLCEMVPDRISAAVLQNPIGFANDNRGIFKNKEWADAMLARDKDLTQATLDGFFNNMFGGDFTFNTTRSAAIFSQAMACLAPRGIAGFVAAPLDPWTPEMFHILAGGRTLRGILEATLGR